MADEILRSKHAFGEFANLDKAIADGKIDAYDILFLDGKTEPKIGWVDKDGNVVILEDKKQVMVVDSLPETGNEDTIYICGSTFYFWNGSEFVASADNAGANAEAIAAINNETTGILAQAKGYTDEKAAAAEKNAKDYADVEFGKDRERLAALEAIDHEHANKELLDTYTQTEADLADAVAKKHDHGNKAVLDGIDATKVAGWDAAEKNAKDYADGLNTAMTGKVDAIDGRLQTAEGAVATKAEQEALTAAVKRIAKNEGDIAANAAAIAKFQPIAITDIEALFA